jgi:hypothetical protein
MLQQFVDNWLQKAYQKVENGNLTISDLEELAAATQRMGTVRQRLLYLHALSPNIHSPLVSMDLHEPFDQYNHDLSPEPVFPYQSVHEAIRDGWQVIKFPVCQASSDRDNGLLGYEFILQKLEAYHV